MKMRSEREMFDLILGVAKADARVRAVTMNGSRADRNARADCFQDWDIAFIVTDVKSFTADPDWIDVFGERMILQLPDDWHSHPYDYNGNEPFNYLMQFMDGTRIDLTVCTIDRFDDEGEPTVALLDKDGILPPLAEPTGECYFIKRPDQKEFHDCCNEFWWLCPYVAKELWREGLPLAKSLLEQNVRAEFMKMLGWYVGLRRDYKVSTGKGSKYIREFLCARDWSAFESTYPNLSAEGIWAALFAMCELFREKAAAVACGLGFEYPAGEGERVTAYLNHVRRLPKDAKAIY